MHGRMCRFGQDWTIVERPIPSQLFFLNLFQNSVIWHRMAWIGTTYGSQTTPPPFFFLAMIPLYLDSLQHTGLEMACPILTRLFYFIVFTFAISVTEDGRYHLPRHTFWYGQIRQHKP